MRKYLLPSALILVLGLGFAIAQNITKSVQLSQDPSGPIGFDTSSNVYFPAHVLTTNGLQGVPSPTAISGSVITIDANATDFSGTITGGGVSSSNGTLTFSKAYLATPHCVVTSQNPGTSPVAYNVVPSGINITSGIGASTINYVCSGAK